MIPGAFFIFPQPFLHLYPLAIGSQKVLGWLQDERVEGLFCWALTIPLLIQQGLLDKG